jgi:hypothetical protein
MVSLRNLSVFSDGASAEFCGGINVSAQNSFWFMQEGWQTVGGTPQRVVEVAVQNTVSGLWSANYIAGTRTLTNDIHGAPIGVRDPASGKVIIFYGSHITNQPYAITVNGDDPSSWTDTGSLSSSTYGYFTFPYPFIYNGTLFLFYETTGAGTSSQESFAVTTATISGGSLSWSGTRKLLFDVATAGNDGWVITPYMCRYQNKIYWAWNYGASVGATKTNLYFAIYDLVTGNVSNADGSVTIAPASQPISKTTMDASFKVLTSAHMGQPVVAVDSSGQPHICYPDETVSPITLNHIAFISGAWTSAHTFYTMPASQTDGYATPVGNNSGGIDIYFTDGSGNGSGQYASGAGNMRAINRSSSGVWGSVSMILAADHLYSCGIGTPLVNDGTITPGICFADTTSDGVTVGGNLRSFIYRDGSLVTRQSPF